MLFRDFCEIIYTYYIHLKGVSKIENTYKNQKIVKSYEPAGNRASISAFVIESTSAELSFAAKAL